MGSVDRTLIVDLSRDLVAQVAPEELVVFDPVSAAWLDDPGRLRSGSGDDMLGFGGAEAVTLLTPVALTVAAAVVGLLRAALAKAAEEQAAAVAGVALQSLFRRFQPAAGAGRAPLGLELLERVRQVAYEKARQGGIGERRAALIADSMVGSLAISH